MKLRNDDTDLDIKDHADAIGEALDRVGELVHEYDRIRDFVLVNAKERLQDVPLENIQWPNPIVAGPAMEALRFTIENDCISGLYLNLLATSLNSETAKYAHPAFVDLIKNMVADEILIMQTFANRQTFPIINIRANTKHGSKGAVVVRHFSHIAQSAECRHPELIQNYLDNLERLGLINIREDAYLTASGSYDALIEDEFIVNTRRQIEDSGNQTPETERRLIEISRFGSQFAQSCITEKT